MQDSGLFLSLAEIAGVFVGFGALIAVRSGGASGQEEIALMRGVVSMGALTIVAALAPVTLGRYDLAERQVWVLSSALVIVGFFVMIVAQARTPEYRANWAAELEADRERRPRWLLVVAGAVYALFMIMLVLGPVVIMLGLWPELDAALYVTVVVLILVGAGWTLLDLVFAQRGSQAT